MERRIYPLTFHPVFRQYLWGGRKLETVLGRDLPPGRVAESWEISGHPSSPTRVANGCWEGKSLPDLLDELGIELVGTNSAAMLARDRFPLLVKLLDASANLSVQVHPDDAYAASHERGELGKAEMWYVLDAEPGAALIYGLEPGCDRAVLEQALAAGQLETILHKLPIHAGDCLDVPPGTVHALLAGALVAEIQQNSDTTYRVYDWDRTGAEGRPRPLHIIKSLDVIDWTNVRPAPVQPRPLAASEGIARAMLVENDKLVVERLTFAAGASWSGHCDGSTFEIWGCLSGQARLASAGDEIIADAVRFVLLPATLGDCKWTATGPSVLLRAYVGATTGHP
jgi:mannose-6-phosphate isomerase